MITRSWDELGMPSTFFDWVPPYFVKQVIYEMAGNREQTEKVRVEIWPDRASFLTSDATISSGILYIDGQSLITDN